MPAPSISLPPLSRSAVAAVFARTSGLCSGTRQIPVARRIVFVHAPAKTRAVKGSAIGISVGIGSSPAEYGYLDEYRSSSTTCSGAHRVEKPTRSAVVAAARTHSGFVNWPIPIEKYPIFMVNGRRIICLVQAAGHFDGFARDPCRFLGGQEHCGRRDIAGLASSAKRCVSHHLLCLAAFEEPGYSTYAFG